MSKLPHAEPEEWPKCQVCEAPVKPRVDGKPRVTCSDKCRFALYAKYGRERKGKGVKTRLKDGIYE